MHKVSQKNIDIYFLKMAEYHQCNLSVNCNIVILLRITIRYHCNSSKIDQIEQILISGKAKRSYFLGIFHEIKARFMSRASPRGAI